VSSSASHPQTNTPRGSQPDTPRVSQPDTPRGSQPDTSRGSQPDTPRGSQPDTPRGSQPDTPRAITHLARTHSRTRQPTTPRDTHQTYGKPARAALRAIQARNEAHRTTTQRSQKEPIQNRKCGQKFGSLDAKKRIGKKSPLECDWFCRLGVASVVLRARGPVTSRGAAAGPFSVRASPPSAGVARELFAPLTWPVKPTLHLHARSTPTKHNHKLNMHQVIDYC